MVCFMQKSKTHVTHSNVKVMVHFLKFVHILFIDTVKVDVHLPSITLSFIDTPGISGFRISNTIAHEMYGG